MTVSRHRHDVRPPNAASDFHEAKARSASRWFLLASSASEATRHRTDRVRGRPAIPDARRADCDSRRGENLSPDRPASDARDAGGGWGGKTGGAGQAADDAGTETAPVIPAPTSEAPFPLENRTRRENYMKSLDH